MFAMLQIIDAPHIAKLHQGTTGLMILASEDNIDTDMRDGRLQRTVTGEPRVDPVRVPQYMYSSKPGAVPNTKVSARLAGIFVRTQIENVADKK